MDIESYNFLLSIPLPQSNDKAPTTRAKNPLTVLKKPLTVLKKEVLKSIKNGDLNALKKCVKEKEDILDEKYWKNSFSLTEMACVQNQVEVLNYLLERGLKIPSIHSNGIPVWYNAIFKDSPELYEILKKEGVVDLEKSDRLSPLMSHLPQIPRLAQHLLSFYGVALDFPFYFASQKNAKNSDFANTVWRDLIGNWLNLCINHFDEGLANQILKEIKVLPFVQQNKDLIQKNINEQWSISITQDCVEKIQTLIRFGWSFKTIPSYQSEPLKLWQIAWERQSSRCLEWFSQSTLLLEQARQDWKKNGPFKLSATPTRIKKLEELGFDMEAKNLNGNTWLHTEFKKDLLSKDFCKWVARNHAPWLDIQNKQGQTPMDVIPSSLRDEFVPMLERLRIKKAAQESGGRRTVMKSKRL